MEKIKKGRRGLYITVGVILGIYALSMLLPCYYLLVNSLKDIGTDYTSAKPVANMWGLPKIFYWDNYANALTFTAEFLDGATVFDLYFNSILFTALSVVLAAVSTTCVAYACARFDFRGKGLLVALGIGALVFPDFGSASVVYKFFKVTGMLGTWWVMLMRLSPFGMMFLIVYSQFTTVSKTYAEAAKIDGASELRVFVQIMVPMVKGPIGMMAVMSAIGAWNDYFTPWMYFKNDLPTIALSMYTLQSEAKVRENVPVLYAMMVMCVIPLVILFVTMRDVIIENAAAGGLKG